MTKGYHHLTYEQRCQIYTLKKRGDSLAQIAKAIKVHRSTVYRELQRNKGLKGYRFKQAHDKAKSRRAIAQESKLKLTTETIATIEELLTFQWSPEQISGWLRRCMPNKAVSHESIYKHIWRDKKYGGSLYKNLRHRGKKYNKRAHKNAGRGFIQNRVDIKERPKIVEEKTRLGDWELDTIIGANHKGAIVSMVDRATKFTRLLKISSKKAKETTLALLKKLGPLKDFVLTLTADNGKEFADHKTVSQGLDADFYFATPYHSWERGLNEHTNGLVRQYFPKGCNFEEISCEEVKAVECLLNSRPRKALNFKAPIEVFIEKSLELKNVALRN
jgi:IS30 family transposase